MEKTNLQNSTKVSRESRTFLIEDSKNFKGLLKGNTYLFRGYKVEVLDSYKDPSKKQPDGTYTKGVKTLFEYKITAPNGTIIEGVGDNEKLRAKVGAKLSEGEGQKGRKKTPIEVAEELIERLEALELLNLAEVREQLEKMKEEKEREERERREKEEKEREERKKAREEIEREIEVLKKKMRELR